MNTQHSDLYYRVALTDGSYARVPQAQCGEVAGNASRVMATLQPFCAAPIATLIDGYPADLVCFTGDAEQRGCEGDAI